MVAHFSDELSAHQYLENLLWPDHPICPRCGVKGRVSKLDGVTTRTGAYKCYACRRIFPITLGTIFHGSRVPLHKWFQAIYLTNGGTAPIRPHHVGKILNVTRKTAVAMMRKLKEAGASNGLYASATGIERPRLEKRDDHPAMDDLALAARGREVSTEQFNDGVDTVRLDDLGVRAEARFDSEAICAAFVLRSRGH